MGVSIDMLYNKKTPILGIGLLLVLVFICSCAQNSNNAQNNYEDILNEAAYEQTKPIIPEVITGTVSFAQNNKDEKAKDETPAATITETAEILETTEITEITEMPVTAEEKVEEVEEAVLFVVTQSGKKYHLQSCYMVKSIKDYFTKEEAEQSKYEPCKICDPH